MLNLDLDEMTFEFKDGAIKHVGPSNKAGTAKLYNVEGVEVREFGDKRVKLAFEDEDDNLVEIALFPEELTALTDGIEALADESDVLE
jgi:hypothetical protein